MIWKRTQLQKNLAKSGCENQVHLDETDDGVDEFIAGMNLVAGKDAGLQYPDFSAISQRNEAAKCLNAAAQ
ncbi:MAG: hypothetical protein A4E49_00763 [Methanosaeta sp. PtaU1.Bin112]|nr:MAG: hypothetical protein A4E49_00763 [Methanosaeta sp. PtaU1.Bin112]